MKAPLNIEAYVDGILKRDTAILSRAITLIESRKEGQRSQAGELLSKILPYTGKSMRLGITGVPGVGKSTFIEAYGQLLSAKGHTVAVLAVDPSSNLSKGSILGDKTRMEKLSSLPGVFIRPSPSGGNLGGVSLRTRETILLCEAAGFDYILIETVGVGQSETEVHSVSDFFLLLMLAGAGDELQGIKRGIMEMADSITITKADGENLQKANTARAEYARAIHLLPPTESGWIPEVRTCSGINGSGMEELYDLVDRYTRHTKHNAFFLKKRQKQRVEWFENLVNEKIRQIVWSRAGMKERYAEARTKIESEELDVLTAIDHIFYPFMENKAF